MSLIERGNLEPKKGVKIMAKRTLIEKMIINAVKNTHKARKAKKEAEKKRIIAEEKKAAKKNAPKPKAKPKPKPKKIDSSHPLAQLNKEVENKNVRRNKRSKLREEMRQTLDEERWSCSKREGGSEYVIWALSTSYGNDFHTEIIECNDWTKEAEYALDRMTSLIVGAPEMFTALLKVLDNYTEDKPLPKSVMIAVNKALILAEEGREEL